MYDDDFEATHFGGLCCLGTIFLIVILAAGYFICFT